MTPSLLLTTLATTPDTTNPLNADYPKRNIVLPPFGVITTYPACSGPSSTVTTPTSNTGGGASECDAYDAFNSRTDRQWTGMPIRAIVPLPRRKRVLNASAQDEATPHNTSTSSTTVLGLPCHTTRSAHFWDDIDSTDSGAENEEKEKEDRGSDEVRDVSSGSRYCSYESITATEGLSAWSFEELRVECYAQSLVARGTKPSPVVQPSLAIPPAFVPRIIPRS